MKYKKKIFKKHFIFDLDGVLFNSIDNMKYSWNKVNKKNKLYISFSKYKKYIGFPFNSILNKLEIKENQKKIQNEYFLFSKKNINSIKLYPKVETVLKKLKKSGKKLSIVTSKKRSNVLILLKKLKITFDFVKTENKSLRGKPFPDLINYCIKKSNIEKKYCLYVGDMPVDLLSAKNANIDFLHAKYGFDSKLKSNKSIYKFSQLLKIYE